MRTELLTGGVIIGEQVYNTLLTNHGLVMIFMVVIPVLIGRFGNMLTPTLVGCNDLTFYRFNAISFGMLPISLGFLVGSGYIEGGSGVSWVVYPPLRSLLAHQSISVDVLVFALHIAGISRLFRSVNFIATSVYIKVEGNAIPSLPLFIWSLTVTRFLLVASLPVLAGGLTLLLLDRNMSTSFFNNGAGGDALLYQHLFWFFGHPEVYVLILPSFGIVRHAIIDMGGVKSVIAYLGMSYRIISIGVVGLVVYAHHIYTVGIDNDRRIYFMIATLVVGIPTGIKLFTGLASVTSSAQQQTSLTLWVFGFLVLFSIGGVTGLVLANTSIDIVIHDTYFVVAHFHYVLSIGSVYGIIVGTMLWCTSMFGANGFDGLAKSRFGTTFIGVNITFIPQFIIGSKGLSRKYVEYADTYQLLMFIRRIGSFVRLGGFVTLLCGMVSAVWGAVTIGNTNNSIPTLLLGETIPIHTCNESPMMYTGYISGAHNQRHGS